MNEWQKFDHTVNLIYPWYTYELLDELKEWNVKNWNIFEYGGGYSTLWWRKKSTNVVSIELINLLHISLESMPILLSLTNLIPALPHFSLSLYVFLYQYSHHLVQLGHLHYYLQ